MHEFGTERTGNVLTLRRAALPRLLKTRRRRATFRREQERRERLLTELRQARLTGIPVTVPTETLTGKLADLPPLSFNKSKQLHGNSLSSLLWT